MFEIYDTINFSINAGFIDSYSDCDAICYGASLNAITAAYATLGYWIQADVLSYLKLSSMGAWAPLVYICAAFGGLFSMAMGQPPRYWTWFFIGPAIYWWLIDSPVEVDAVSWRVGNVQMDQREVWRYAETGLKNASLYNRYKGRVKVYSNKKPDRPVIVAMPFLWVDALISGTVQSLVAWTGVHTQHNQTDVSAANTNVALEGSPEGKAWFLLSNLKWKYLQDITNSRMASVEARDMFTRFFTSECGDKVAEAIDIPSYLAATNSKGKLMPDSVFLKTGANSALGKKLAEEWLPFPRSMRNVFADKRPNSFREAVSWGGGGAAGSDRIDEMLDYDRIRCDTYFHVLMYYLRWEAGGIYHQTFANTAPEGMDGGDIAYNLLYGWDIKVGRTNGGGGAQRLSSDQQEAFIKDLILLHLVRNELSMVPRPVTAGHAESELTQIRADSFIRTVGSTAKYGEVYTWAMMIPHIQGILLMLLAMAYPFVAIVVLIPGHHGIMFTWLSFFVWAKIWDVGFALVTAIERSVWSTLGAGVNNAKVNDRIVAMQELGSVNYVGCDAGGNIGGDCFAPIINVTDAVAGQSPVDGTTVDAFNKNLEIFDLSLALGTNLDLDVANGFYIYLMAALYFAVPAVTGQLVLGAKAGAASLVDQGTSDISQKGGMGAQRGFEGSLSQKFMSNQASARQSAKAKAYRATGLAHQAMGYQNRSAQDAMDASFMGQIGEGHGRVENALALTKQAQDSYAAADFTTAKAMLGRQIQQEQETKAVKSQSQGHPPGADGPELTGSDPHGANQSIPGSEAAGGVPATGNFGAQHSLATGEGTDAAKAAKEKYRSHTGDKGDWLDKVNMDGTYDVAKAWGDARRSEQLFRQENAHRAAAGDASIAGFGMNQRSSGYRSAGERLMSEAEFEAAAQTYDTMNRFGNAMASDATIAGANIGQLDAGPRPDDMMGMATTGMLNTSTRDTRARANYFKPGNAFFNRQSKHEKTLNGKYGSGAIMSTYKGAVAGQQFAYSFYSVGKEAGKAIKSGALTGSQTK